MDFHRAAVSVKGNSGEASKGCMDEHAGDGLVWHELCVMVQQRGHLDGDTLFGEDYSRRGVHPIFSKIGTPCSDTKMPVRAHIRCRLHFFCQEMHSYGRKMSFSQY